ncbi:ABC transporter ATP-binding protein [Roseiarcaceae bacterium H3SJ34-1]|uniref:ABC transporter ATP-binding protein n=1 Tax=Terripilifer ovatus TaxID=3032367 RepID=UPI003AB928FB|nr:ABC transporter ATP-binding protein [Roseiarcaceae bacterium H3SJ34-1]
MTVTGALFSNADGIMLHVPPITPPPPVLSVDGLRVELPGRAGPVFPVRGISFDIAAGETLGVVGESGAGKSMTGAAVLGLIDPGGKVSGEIRLNGERIDALPEAAMRDIRGKRIGAIFQDPMTALDPLFTIGDQLVETILTHQQIGLAQALGKAEELLASVGLPEPRQRLSSYPHQMSGGMRQRVVIAMALANDPDLVIADEPTTALDVSIQAQIIALLRKLSRERKTSVMLVTHDMGVIAEVADRVAVMYGGRIVEMGAVADVLRSPRHPYTRGLIESIPRLGQRKPRLYQIEGAMPSLDAMPAGCAFHPRCANAIERCLEPGPALELAGSSLAACWRADDPTLAQLKVDVPPGASQSRYIVEDTRPLVEVEAVSQHFSLAGSITGSWFQRLTGKPHSGVIKAVDTVSFAIARGETFALVGESGCGKSTLARAIVGLQRPTMGRVLFAGDDVAKAGAQRRFQMIFQDPYSSLNPRWRVADIIAEPIRTHGLDAGKGVRRRVDDLLAKVGLTGRDGDRYPHEFSGGQRQRISIARALAGEPEFIVCDEPTSALDVSVQAQILNLLKDLQFEFGLTLLFISHNLAVVRHMADRLAVMRNGRIVETGTADSIFTQPADPYTRQLFDAVPDIELALARADADHVIEIAAKP